MQLKHITNIRDFHVNSQPIPAQYLAVYRLRTEHYGDANHFYFKKSFRYMKTMSSGWNPFDEELQNVSSVEEAFGLIVNLDLDNMEDGLYSLVTVNAEYDEYGTLDFWEYMLIPIDKLEIDAILKPLQS